MSALKTETNTTEMWRRVLSAARAHLGLHNLHADFEHGQWWITARSGAQWSVVDAEGPGTTDGFDFEQVGGTDLCPTCTREMFDLEVGRDYTVDDDANEGRS